ncbi:MAG TPA: hypothetical protein VGG82_10285 [Casimicrobiaceae bacterium]
MVLDADAVANAQVSFARILDDERASRVQTHRGPKSGGVDFLFGLVTECPAADRAVDRGSRGAAATADLAADDAARRCLRALCQH